MSGRGWVFVFGWRALSRTLLWAYWGFLPESVQEPTSWWFLLSAAVPTGWILFGVFHRPPESLRRTSFPLAVLAGTTVLGVWRIALWANRPDEVRSIFYLWPLLVLLLPALWVRRSLLKRFAEYPRYSLPCSIVIGLNLGLLLLAIGACLYIFYSHEALVDRTGVPNFTDTRAGFILIALALEMTRRNYGPPLPILSLI